MCRAVPPRNFRLKVNKGKKYKIKQKAPEEFKAQLAEPQQYNEFDEDCVNLKLIIGNRREILKAKDTSEIPNPQRWTIFAKLVYMNVNLNNIIANIRFVLHDSFGVGHMEVKANKE